MSGKSVELGGRRSIKKKKKGKKGEEARWGADSGTSAEHTQMINLVDKTDKPRHTSAETMVRLMRYHRSCNRTDLA